MNDSDDPYLTDDGKLVFAVPRAPVDGAPNLVSRMICSRACLSLCPSLGRPLAGVGVMCTVFVARGDPTLVPFFLPSLVVRALPSTGTYHDSL